MLATALGIEEQARDFHPRDKDALCTADSLLYMCTRFDTILLHMRQPEYSEDDGGPKCKPEPRDVPFVSVTDAYLQLEIIFNYTADIIISPGPNAVFWNSQHTEQMEWSIQIMRQRLSRWEGHFKQLKLRAENRHALPLKLLELRVKLLRLLMHAKSSNTPDELCWDDFKAQFSLMIEDAKTILVMRYAALAQSGKSPQRTRTFTVTPMIKDLLYIIARLCRDPAIRRRTFALFAHDYYVSPDADTPTYIAMATAIKQLEETEWRATAVLQRNEPSCGCKGSTRGYATLWVKTVDDVYNDGDWRKVQIKYGSYQPALIPLMEI
ncbi:hypothetical protein NLG97_g5330 [Lecanicillium saksenae]|uniref:Uncharacterized protein n=1 Tax=Lecanicillium saksenae TaxID=468837 RepID=A0ACC1QWL7_9HYPO|nr:hypothetical protein NLG97_g5330 [Lecanicillium saksenae]